MNIKARIAEIKAKYVMDEIRKIIADHKVHLDSSLMAGIEQAVRLAVWEMEG